MNVHLGSEIFSLGLSSGFILLNPTAHIHTVNQLLTNS